jgi:hypothetical protein
MSCGKCGAIIILSHFYLLDPPQALLHHLPKKHEELRRCVCRFSWLASCHPFFPLSCDLLPSSLSVLFRVSSSRSEYVICNWFCTVKYCGQCRCVRVNSFFIINMLQVLQLPPPLPPPLATWFSQLPFVLVSAFKSIWPFLAHLLHIFVCC